jgi:LacI family gluconate utilization system Gnt-I transcriptional repressor
MRDVARHAGVSTITVSRALFRPEKVAEETRRRVLRTVQKLGYLPNMVAGSLSSNRTRVVAAIVPHISNPVYGRTIHAMAEVLRKHNLHLLLGNSGFSAAEEERLLAPFLALRPQGVLLHGRRHTTASRQYLRQAGIPIVETGDLDRPALDMLVSYSNKMAAQAMTAHLLERGYRRIGFVSTPIRENDRHLRRRQGYEAALLAHSLTPKSRRILEVSFGFQSGAAALDALLARDEKIDAVFFASDVLAVGALLECLRRGWRVPHRIAIAGFDDQEIAAEAVPPLTTVRIPREEIGRLAGEMLVARSEGRPVEPRIVDVGFEIIPRAST